MKLNMHAKAVVGGEVIAETDSCEVVDGNIYFPPSSVNQSLLRKSDTHTRCPWKGEASYYNILIDKTEWEDAAWSYPETKEEADHIKNYIAFYNAMVDVTHD